jgi:hypothetical protein
MNFMNHHISSPQRQTTLSILFGIVIFLILIFGVHQYTQGNDLGYDFYYYWNSSRAFVFEGLSPFSDQTTLENQIGLYGHPAVAGQDPVHFKNPIYSIFLVIPLSVFPYDWAQAIWITVNLFSVLLVGFFTFPKLPKWMIALFVFFYPVAFCIVEGNFSLISGLTILLFLGVFFIQKKKGRSHQIIIGILLSISTYKPQLSWLFLIWILVYAFHEHLYPFVIAFIGNLFIESTIMLLFFPTWPIDFLKRLPDYQIEAHLTSVRTQIFMPYLPFNSAQITGNILLGGLLLLMVYLFIHNRFIDLPSGILQISLIGLTTFIAHPSGFSTEQICMIIPVLVWLGASKQIGWKESFTWIILFIFSYIFLFMGWRLNDSGIILKGPLFITLVWIAIVTWQFFTRSYLRAKVTNPIKYN